MTIYEYRCDNPSCRQRAESTRRGDELGQCPVCNLGTLRRRFSFSVAPAMQEHFNHTINKPVSSMRQFRDELSKASEEYFLRTGNESKFVPKDWGELGATDEGLDRTNEQRSREGLPPLRLP